MMSLDEIDLLYNSIPTACIILRPNKPNYTIASVNKAFLSAIYTPRSALLGQGFFEAFPANPDDDGSRTQNILEAFDHVLKHQTPHLIKQHRYDLPSSNSTAYVQYWKIETYPLLNEEGAIQYIVQSSTDITALVEAEGKLEENNIKTKHELQERKQIEHALQLSNERFSYVNKATNDAIYDWDLEVDHIYWGDAFYRLFGYQKEKSFPIDKWAAMVHPEDIEDLRLSLNNTLRDPKQTNWITEYRFKRLDCRYAYVEENGYILRDEQGQAKRMIGVLRDITEKRLAEAELQSLKDTYSDLFHLSPLPMFVFDLNSLLFLDVNNAAITHYGYTREEFLTLTIKQIRPPEDTHLFDKVYKHEIKPKVFHTREARHVKKTGEIIWVNTKGNSIIYDGREARIVVAVDITDRIESEKALIKSERRFKTLIHDGSDLIAILDTNGIYNYVSPSVGHILDMGDTDLVGKMAFDFIHEDDRKHIISQFETLPTTTHIKLTPYRFIDKKKRIHWVETIITDMRDDDAIGGIVCNSRVVTDRVERETKLKEHLDRFNAVSKATSDSIWDMDMASGRLLWNHGIKGIFGYKELEQSYEWWYDRVHPEDIIKVTQTIEHSILQTTPRWTSEYRFRCADGTYKDVLDRGFLIFDNDTGKPVRMIGAMQDISERVAYTKAIEKHNNQLKEIAWTQAHLVRAPLTRILGIIPLLTDPATEVDTRKTLFSYLEVSANDLDQIIQEVIGKSDAALKKT